MVDEEWNGSHLVTEVVVDSVPVTVDVGSGELEMDGMALKPNTDVLASMQEVDLYDSPARSAHKVLVGEGGYVEYCGIIDAFRWSGDWNLYAILSAGGRSREQRERREEEYYLPIEDFVRLYRKGIFVLVSRQ